MNSTPSNRHSLAVLALLVVATGTTLAGSGAWDRTYAPSVSGPVYTMGLQADGKLVMGGAFTSVNGSNSRSRLARLYSDGSLDSTFFASGSGVAGIIWSLAVQTDGRIVIGGEFSSVNGTSRTRVARLNSNGTVDGSFVPTNTIPLSVLAVAPQSDNKVVIGGTFTGGTFPSYNARLNADGTTDTAFSSIPNGAVNAIAIQSDGKIVIGGAFTTVNGAARNRIARLNSDGSLDSTFQNGLSGASSTVRCLQIQADGKILIGGDFTTVNGTSRSYVARLNTNGSLDTGFLSSSGPSGSVYALVAQSDSTVLIGGAFSAYANVSLSRVARLYADGTRDTTFTNFGINNLVQALAVQTDGGTLIGGTFTTINNTNQNYLGRLYGNLYPPEFVTQPLSRNTNVGANVTFSAQVNNPTATGFQWRKDGNNLAGATGTAYTIFNVQFADAGNYSVFVSNGAGGTTSTNALLQVGIAPAFTSQASSLSVTQGQSASFTVTATGTPLNYFWKKNGVVIPGQTNASLNFASVVPTNAATYTCQVSNFLGNITSTGAVLTVAFPPTISVQPVGNVVGVGSNFTVSVTASGTPAIAYQWRTNGIPIVGATLASFTKANAQTSDSADYDVLITNSMGSVTSTVASISVVYYPPTIGTQPVGGNILVGSDFVLSATASGTAPLAWQWRTNGTPISGASSSTYAINNAQLADSGTYDVVVTNSTGSATSSVAIVNVGYAPVVLQQPVSATNLLGGTNIFSCLVTGTVPINLQWTFNGTAIANATNAILTLTNLQPANIGYYALTATNAFGGTASSNATLNLQGYEFSIWNALVAYYPFNGNAHDATQNGNDGAVTNAILFADRFGQPSSAYYFNGTNAEINCGNGPAFNFGNGGFTVTCWVRWTNFVGNYFVSKYTCPEPNSWGLGAGGSGSTYAFVKGNSSTASLSGNLLHNEGQWHCIAAVVDRSANLSVYRDGQLDRATNLTAITGLLQNASPLLIGRIGDSGSCFGPQYFEGGIDDVRIYNRALSSNEVTQLFALEGDQPVITLQPQGQTNSLGGTVLFSVSATANHPLAYQWFKDGGALAGATNTSLVLSNLQPNQIGYYSVMVSNGVAGVASSNAALNLFGYDFGLSRGLVAYYPFNGNASDTSGNGNNVALIGTTYDMDRFGLGSQCLLFNGTTDFVAYTNLFYFTNYTFSLWANISTNNAGSGSDQGWRVFMQTEESPGFSYQTADFAVNPGLLRYQMDSGNGVTGGSRSAGVAVDDFGTWRHFVGTFDGVNISLYLDGVPVQGTAAGSPAPNPAGRQFLLGAVAEVGHQNLRNFFAGFMDDVRIYNRALSSNEVAQLYALDADQPAITQQPQAQTVPAGGFATFTVSAAANHLLTYQWRKGATVILGATNNILVLTNVQSTDVGFYSVVVSNGVAGVVSAGALLNLAGFADPTWNGLVAYYPFNGNANDESGNTNHGVISNCELTLDRLGHPASAYWFNGSNSVITVPNRDSLNLSSPTDFTLSVWATRANSLLPSFILGKDAGNGRPVNTKWVLILGRYHDPATPTLTFHYIGDLNSLHWPGTAGINEETNVWHHYTVSRSGSTFSFFEDGRLLDAENLGTPLSSSNPAPLTIGNAEGGGWHAGLIDDLRIYNRALSVDEVAHLYQLESQATPVVSLNLAASLGVGPSLNLLVSGLPGRSYILQSATSLTPPIVWAPILTNAADTNGLWPFIQTNLASPQQFYRVITP